MKQIEIMSSLKENIAYVSERLSNSTIPADVLAKNVKSGDTYTWNGSCIHTDKVISIRETKSRIFFTISENGKPPYERRGIGHNSYFFF